jgi:predicted O-methyltransferase YrrM
LSYYDPIVKIDACHAALIGTLVRTHKPARILELGIGGGTSTNQILEAIAYNQYQPSYTLVDNWVDWGGVMPPEVEQRYGNSVELVTSDEKAFVASCEEQYDFIFSDADHRHANEWFGRVYDRLLAREGILIYHDINLYESDFPNLREIYHAVLDRQIHHVLLNKNSRDDERCDRGLLVIFKH